MWREWTLGKLDAGLASPEVEADDIVPRLRSSPRPVQVYRHLRYLRRTWTQGEHTSRQLTRGTLLTASASRLPDRRRWWRRWRRWRRLRRWIWWRRRWWWRRGWIWPIVRPYCRQRVRSSQDRRQRPALQLGRQQLGRAGWRRRQGQQQWQRLDRVCSR